MKKVPSWPLVLMLAALAAAAAVPTRSAARGPTGCAQGRTLLQTGELRVFRSSRPGDTRVYGCLRGRRPIRHLGWAPMDAIAAAGHFFANAEPPFEQETPQIVVRNARYAHSIWHYYAGAPFGCPSRCPADYEHDRSDPPSGVSAILVTRRGRAAWIEGWVLSDGRTRYDVVRTFLP